MSAAPSRAGPAGAASALVVNAFVWGVSWWPFRQLSALGLHPLWATSAIYALSAAAIVAWRPGALRQLATEPALWLVFLAAGTTNATFNWAVSIGDVVRIVLLFYLMPLWTLLLARLVLGEPLTRLAIARVVLAMAGAGLVLSGGAHAGDGPAPAANAGLPLAELLALLGGFAFAVNNVMIRRQAARPQEGRALAMFVGGSVVAGTTAAVLSWSGAAGVAWPVAPGAWLLPATGLALAFMVSNLCLQYGAARLTAATTAIVMSSEVVFAALTAVWWGGATLRGSVLVGGALILAAALMSVRNGSGNGH